MNKLENIIRSRVTLGRKNSKGWEECLHITCDHGRKGNRAAFLFDGDNTSFHCFNCEVGTGFSPAKDTAIAQKMLAVLADFGIHEEEIQQISMDLLSERDKDGHSTAGISFVKRSKIEPNEIPFEDCFYSLSSAPDDDMWKILATHYLITRGIDPNSHDFMLSRKECGPHQKKWYGRVIIPTRKNGKLIFYQGRSLIEHNKKYESPTSDKQCVLGGFDLLFKDLDKPLYVVEGWFDSHLLDGVALFGNNITPEQIEWLNKSPRNKVYIPDRYGDGKEIARKCLSLKWDIAVPFDGWDSKIKDINDAILKYGKVFVMTELAKYTFKHNDFAAEVYLQTIC